MNCDRLGTLKRTEQQKGTRRSAGFVFKKPLLMVENCAKSLQDLLIAVNFGIYSQCIGSAEMADADKMSGMAQVAQVFFDTTLKFYDKAPIIAGTGYLLITSSLPLWIVLKFFVKMKHLDNQKVIAMLQRQVSISNPVTSDKTEPVMTTVSPAATPPQT
ncbi:hypothetical protein ACYATZ_21900 [Klebsiella pneumoniae]|nr:MULTISPECIES: hypothetical protein [Klebsiella]MBZ1762567.1 hypothetical protein [Klebsiella pneumoniae]MBZ7538627.1 hypothetical protein [Klebsiella quasipneumoniae]QGV94584.1 hypothetical protein F7P06_19460 [Klebsiella pneumoniae]